MLKGDFFSLSIWSIQFFFVPLHHETNKDRKIMDYEMKKVMSPKDYNACYEMCEYILSLLKGTKAPERVGGTTYITEKLRQFYTWGAKSFKLIGSTDGCYGLQFKVTGLKHRGRVRIYYNPASDYFDVELLRDRKDALVWGCEDLDFEQLHNVLHQHIERTDDVEV